MLMEPYLLNGDSQAPVARCRARCWSGPGCRQVALFANMNVLRNALWAAPLRAAWGAPDTADHFAKLASWKHELKYP